MSIKNTINKINTISNINNCNLIDVDADIDTDTLETKEWLDAFHSVIKVSGPERAAYLLRKQISYAKNYKIAQNLYTDTTYLNTITEKNQVQLPGNFAIEQKISAYIRWNAMMMVLKANKNTNVGGHIASFQSAATLYDVGFNYFWRARSDKHAGDLIFIQGHCSPGIYARAYLLGYLSENQLNNFRQETEGVGLSSYPHPWLMPNFWQFPTVSMGLGPIMAIYQARFMQYLQDRDLVQTQERKVWAFIGDGETDEPESIGALSVAGREKLDNLIFVINCNLQRLDGPVRGNGNIISELEGVFLGASWNVIKLIWGDNWDALFARDTKGILAKRLSKIVDGEYQTMQTKNGAYIREKIFNTPELLALVSDLSDQQLEQLNSGGHDVQKVYAAFHAANSHLGQPTVILVKTVKGYGMGASGQSQNTTHQQKKMALEDLRNFRDKFEIPVSDENLSNLPFVKFTQGSIQEQYMQSQAQNLGGFLPKRNGYLPEIAAQNLISPSLAVFNKLLEATLPGREISTTMAFVRILTLLIKDKSLGKYIVPIVPDESRTFGMEGMFSQLGIWSHVGQLYTPQDQGQLMFYKEDIKGQVLQEGINEAGAMSDWIAAATSYSVHGVQTIPFYIFYSMFGFQRIGDLAWAAADMRSRGFLLGGTAGRTTLNGEGLQHQDGHSHLLAAAIPNCISYDPTFSYELAIIIYDGLRRMLGGQGNAPEDIYYYITLMNENYTHPAQPPGIEADLLKGMYLFKSSLPIDSQDNSLSQANPKTKPALKVQLLGSGTIFREVIFAHELLQKDWEISSDLWSCPSFTELSRQGAEIDRWNMLHPNEIQRKSHVEMCLQKISDDKSPVIAATDYIRMFAEQIRPLVQKSGRRYSVLGTDGFGRSDTREKLRHFFEVDRYWITIAALCALADDGKLPRQTVALALEKYNLDPEKPNPVKV